MNEIIIEKLVQKISNLLEEWSDLNVLIRGLKPSQELLNATNSRLDAIRATLTEVESFLKTENVQLAEMEKQLKVMTASLAQLQMALNDLPAKVGVKPDDIQKLKIAMSALLEQLRQPLTKDVVVHHVMKGPMVTIVGYLASVIFFVLLVHCWSRIDLRKERDVKYRWLQAFGVPGINPYFHYIDSFYRSDPAQFDKMTIELEEMQERRMRLDDPKR